MKYILCLLFSMYSLIASHAQKYFDVGLTGGVSYYLGDINPSRQFYRPSPAMGGFVRFNLNNREALRVSLIYMGLKGDGKDFPNNYSQTYYDNFHTSFTEISAVYEFHFLPYVTNKRKNGFSPYLYGGLGYMTFVSAPSNKGNYFSVPFGAGVKYTLSKKIGLGAEWGMRKFFNDYIDGVINPGGENVKTFLNNNDWYSFAGFFISFRLNDNSADCPVYW